MLSVEQVAERLGLHVRTVRGYIRSGRLPAVRIGKQYRIARPDLDALTGRPTTTPPAAAHVEVSTIVQIDGIDRAAADRIATFVLAGAHNAGTRLGLQSIHDPERNRMKIVILGPAVPTADVLHLLDSILTADNGLLDG
jgi:excisionase family DNA binding protein